MNISEKMKELFSRQISHELHNHQVYRFFGNRLCNIGLNKIGTFMKWTTCMKKLGNMNLPET